MTLFDITPVGAFVNAVEAAVESDRQAARRDSAHGREHGRSRRQITPRLRAAASWPIDLAKACHRAFVLRLAARRLQ